MLAKKLLSDTIPALRTSDTGKKALNWMEVFRISHLPIVNHTEFLGIISDNDIYDLNLADTAIGAHTLSLQQAHVFADQHIYDIIKLVHELHLTIIPVLDHKNKYLGVINLQKLVHAFNDMASIQNNGSLIVLEVSQHDYSLTEIAQIIESNDAKVLSLYISSPPNSMRLEITIKLNIDNIAPIIQTFERYDYQIKASYSDNDLLEDLYDDRMDSLLNYLSI